VKIFFSHSGTNRPLIRDIAQHLRRPLEAVIEDVPAGEQLTERLEAAVRDGSSYVAVFLDKAAIESPWVQAEIDWALKKESLLRRPLLVPVVLDSRAAKYAARQFKDRVYQKCLGRDSDDVQLSADRLSRDIFTLMSAHLERVEASDGESQPVWTLRSRSELSTDDWRKILLGANQRIWLLGHTMVRSVHPKYTGHVLNQRLSEGVDVRIVVLDPKDPAQQQIREITAEMHDLDVQGKIKTTIEFATNFPVRAETQKSAIKLATTRATIHNSIVIVEDRVIVTLYSHNNEMGDTGITLDLHATTDPERCKFFETEFNWHWRNARLI